MHLQITGSTSSDGVLERAFLVGEVPGVLWTPPGAAPGMPLLLLGHGGGLHSRAPGLQARARQAVLRDGFAVAAVDAPGHGARVRSPQDRELVAAVHRARELHAPLGPVLAPLYVSLAARAVPEWRATLDALQALPDVGAGPVGYAGMTLASAIGIPLLLAEPRVRAAVLGGLPVYDGLLEAARRVTVPVELLLPWEDEELDRAAGLALFDALGSREKTLLAFPEPHTRVPTDRLDTGFFARVLGSAATAPAGSGPR